LAINDPILLEWGRFRSPDSQQFDHRERRIPMNHSQQSGMDAAAYQLKPAGLGTGIGYRNPKSPVEASRKMLSTGDQPE
jgi:hypothetical protein